MKFSKLVKIITEAKGTKPGDRYFSAKNREGPAGVVSGPIGKSDNFEKRGKLNRWEFNPAMDLDKKSTSGIAEASKIWKAMKNAFGILANDSTFQAQVSELAKEFDKNRDAYKNMMSLELGDGEKIDMAYDEEAKSNSLPKTIQSQESRLTGYEDEVRKRQIIINHNKMSPSQRFELEKDIAGLRGKISVLEKGVKEAKSSGNDRRVNRLTEELRKSNIQLNRWEDVWSHLGIDKSGLDSIKSEIFDYQKKIAEWTKKLVIV
jgi:hypothetical protein